MTVIYTNNMLLEKPTVGNSLNAWGAEVNKTIDLLDNAIFSNNFAPDTDNHSGLNFAYKNGRVSNGVTVTSVVASTILLIDASTNYIEISADATISANTTGFSVGKIPLFTVVTVGGALSTITDKRSYFTVDSSSFFTFNLDSIESNYNLLIGTGVKKSWSTTYEYIQLSGSNSISYTKVAGADSELHITNNAYYDSTDTRWEYISTDQASQIILEDGTIKLKTAASGTADNAVTFLNVLEVDENQHINTTATKKSWIATSGVIQLGGNDGILYNKSAGADSELHITNNAYYDSIDTRWEYISTDQASIISLEDGTIKLKTKVSGTADNAINFLTALEVDENQNILLNNATVETSSIGAWTIKQGTDPTTSTADQISIFATSGASSTLGIRSEETVLNDVLRVSVNGTNKYIHMRETNLNPLSSFISSTVTVVNTTTKTEVMSVTIPGRASPSGQYVEITLATVLNTAVAAHQCLLTFDVGGDTPTIYSSTSATLSNSRGWVKFYVFIKSATEYAYLIRASFGGYTWTSNNDFTDDFTTDTDIIVSAQWNTADVGTQFDGIGGVIEIKN